MPTSGPSTATCSQFAVFASLAADHTNYQRCSIRRYLRLACSLAVMRFIDARIPQAPPPQGDLDRVIEWLWREGFIVTITSSPPKALKRRHGTLYGTPEKTALYLYNLSIFYLNIANFVP
ncbi:hypothetical protein K449DRAFT_390143 [Hypoxylon sp. EC38]|nr:hypothetical protein K449DRAFT_390143 [Hypoxylon sp. EC38]